MFTREVIFFTLTFCTNVDYVFTVSIFDTFILKFNNISYAFLLTKK